MKQTTPFVITISRQLGSGGAYIGQQLASRLNIFYADREIISKAAKQLSVLEEDIEFLEEKAPSFWQSFFQSTAFNPEIYVPQKMLPPTDRELFEVEAEVIERIAKENSAVVIGRCGFHVLREFPNLISIFLYANQSFRNKRIQELYEVSKEMADSMILKNDKGRASYCKNYTGKEWVDARNYDLSIDTGKVDLDKTVEIILNYLKTRGINI